MMNIKFKANNLQLFILKILSVFFDLSIIIKERNVI